MNIPSPNPKIIRFSGINCWVCKSVYIIYQYIYIYYSFIFIENAQSHLMQAPFRIFIILYYKSKSPPEDFSKFAPDFTPPFGPPEKISCPNACLTLAVFTDLEGIVVEHNAGQTSVGRWVSNGSFFSTSRCSKLTWIVNENDVISLLRKLQTLFTKDFRIRSVFWHLSWW